MCRKFHRDGVNIPSRWSNHSIAMEFSSITHASGKHRGEAYPRSLPKGREKMVAGFWFQPRLEDATLNTIMAK